jgi:hypothetical protein
MEETCISTVTDSRLGSTSSTAAEREHTTPVSHIKTHRHHHPSPRPTPFLRACSRQSVARAAASASASVGMAGVMSSARGVLCPCSLSLLLVVTLGAHSRSCGRETKRCSSPKRSPCRPPGAGAESVPARTASPVPATSPAQPPPYLVWTSSWLLLPKSSSHLIR